MHFLLEERHGSIEDLTFRNGQDAVLNGTEAHKQRGDFARHPYASAHAREPAKRAVAVLAGREGGEHSHAPLLLLHFVEERQEALPAGLLLLCLNHPRGLVEQDVCQLLVLDKRTLQCLRVVFLCPALNDGPQTCVFVGKMIGDAASVIGRGDRKNVVVLRSRQGRQSLQGKRHRIRNVLDDQGLIDGLRVAACEEL